MSELDDFVAETHPRLIAGLQALHDGDSIPQLDSWSTQDPVTIFGARVPLRRGLDEVSETLRGWRRGGRTAPTSAST